jgi:diguanylate cyclase (GGDEF)-like protein
LHRDGTIIVRYPDPKNRAYESMPAASPWHQLVLQGGGQYRSPGYFDNEPRLVSVHPLRDYPLVVNVAVSETAALATWRIQAITLGTGALLVMLCLAFLLKAQSKQFRRLATSEATVEAALNNMSQGLVMFDSSNLLVVCNRRYLEMYGLSSDIVRPGGTLRELVEHRAAIGSFGADDVEQYITDIQAAIGQGAVFSKITSLRDGRIISIVNHPTADGGWVATHEDVTEQKRAEERISYAAHHDSLTGLPNRKLFCEQLEQALKRVRRGERLAVLYLDLDHLKRINDTLGHPAGDKLLKGVADRLRGCVRDIDLVARLSGDEFAIIQTSLDGPADVVDLAMRAREAIHEPFDLDGHEVTVDISVGISMAPNDATDLNELLKTADIALYEAKNTGRGIYCFYQTEMNERMKTRSKLERDLQSALTNGEFELFYQPIVNLEDNKIKTFEALLRWRHPERGLVSPTEFIPIAEETGLIVPLGEWVLRQACAEAAKWPNDIGVAVNISSVQLTNKNLANAVIGAIASASIPAARLNLEITESVFLQNTAANLATLKRLHELGVQFSMDDFGTGYSSLGYLLSFPFSKIKIDRSFITDLPTKKGSRAIIRAIIDLARSLKIRVIAEGVETAQQLEQLRRLGCTEIQGYLFSPPRPVAEIRQFFLPNRKGGQGVVSIESQVA